MRRHHATHRSTAAQHAARVAAATVHSKARDAYTPAEHDAALDRLLADLALPTIDELADADETTASTIEPKLSGSRSAKRGTLRYVPGESEATRAGASSDRPTEHDPILRIA